MVSTTLKLKYSTAKLGQAAGKILPVFSRENVSEFTKGILRENEDIRQAVITNPRYLPLLEQKVEESFRKYRGVIRGGKVVDSWDRVTSALGLAADAVGPFSGFLGNLLSAGEEIVELIPKGIYAAYYLTKTGDWKAIPYWTAAEAASFIPYLGDAIDMTNIYINRARKLTSKKAAEEFRKTARLGNLENRVQFSKN